MTQTISEQTDFYNEWFSSFRHANQLQLERAWNILQAINLIGFSEPKIVDLGCGPGWLANILGTFGPTLGVDLSTDAIEVARRRYPITNFEAADIFNWDYPKGAFDIVVSQEVLEHVENQARYLEIAHELLRPDGYLIITTPNRRTMMAMPPEQRKNWTDQPIENWLTQEQLTQLLQQKFTVVRKMTIVTGMGSKGSYRLMNSHRIESIAAKLGLGDSFNRLHGKLAYGLHLLAVARKKSVPSR